MVGQLIDGRYLISREIAVGGMGVVYEAKHVKIGRSVAIKVLHREMASDSEIVGRFLNEARAMGTIGHPNIVACTDFGELPGPLPYLVLEYLDGRTVGQEIATVGPFPVARALRICVQVASALEAAHTRGVIHRDLTSGNVFLTKTEGDWDHAKVLDFGISKFLTATDASPKTRRGFTMGTPEFMAPEQITHPDSVDARGDVYSLGVILYQMLAGKTPFGGVGVQTLFLQVVGELPPAIERTDIPAEVLALLDRALAKNAVDRFSDMQEMGAELEMLAPPSMLSGNYSGRVELSPGAANRPATGSRPILRSTTSRQSTGAQSGVYAAASRTSLVEMATKAAASEQAPAPRSRRSLVVIALGLVAVASVAGIMVGRGHDAAPSKTASVAPGALAPVAPASRPEAPAPTGPVRLQVTSTTPSARVTFRGRTHQLPFSESVASDTKLELVEITAQGREGKRFWLTIDRQMQLSVDLSPGRGVIEATTEEALVALGERTPDVAQPESPPGGDPGASKHGSSSSSSSSHRPGARGKLVAAAVTGKKDKGGAASGTVAAPEPTAPPSSATANPSVKTAAAPPPEPAVAPVPQPKAPPPEPAPPPVIAAKPPAPASHPAPAPAVAAVVKPVGGTVDAARAQQVFVEHNSEIQRCHQRAKIDNSDVKGRLVLRIGVSPSGQVTSTTTESSNLRNHALDTCIMTAVQGWPFPPAVGGPATLQHVFVLR